MRNKVKEFRITKGIAQKELAEYAGITRQTLSLIEKSEYNPSLKLCLKICYGLDKTLDEIFWVEKGEKGEKNNR